MAAAAIIFVLVGGFIITYSSSRTDNKLDCVFQKHDGNGYLICTTKRLDGHSSKVGVLPDCITPRGGR
jgi:hypothetical protein